MVEQWAMTGRFELAGGQQDDKKMPYVEGSAGGAEVRTLVSGAETGGQDHPGATTKPASRLIASTLADRETLTASELADLHMNGARPGRRLPPSGGSGSGHRPSRSRRPR